MDDELKIGTKRNYACLRCSSDYIAIWDDDDYQHPKRLGVQVAILQASRKAVTGFQLGVFQDSVTGEQWLYDGGPSRVLGLSMMFTKEWWLAHPFPPLQIAEEEQFYQAAFAAREIEPSLSTGLIIASIHPGNTSPRTLSGPNWKRLLTRAQDFREDESVD
jgi:glycosyltransferase involved in cell wall biosynthesis